MLATSTRVVPRNLQLLTFPVNMPMPLTELAILPGTTFNGNDSEQGEDGIAVGSETKAAANSKEGNPITRDTGDRTKSKEGGQGATTQVVPIAPGTCVVADAIVGHRFRRGTRISSTLKQAAQAAYNKANSMFYGTRVTGLGAESPEQQRAQHRRPCQVWARHGICQYGSACRFRHDDDVPGRQFMVDVHFLCQETGGAPSERRGPELAATAASGMQLHPRRGPVKGLRRALDQEKRRRGRTLTPEEWQAVRDWCIQRNRLKEMGLDFCFINQRENV